MSVNHLDLPQLFQMETLIKYYEIHISFCVLVAGNYIGKSSYKFMDVKQAFEYAYHTLSKAVLKDFSNTHDR